MCTFSHPSQPASSHANIGQRHAQMSNRRSSFASSFSLSFGVADRTTSLTWRNSLSSLLATEYSVDVMTLGFILRHSSMISGVTFSAKYLTVFSFAGNTLISFSNSILAKAFRRVGSSAGGSGADFPITGQTDEHRVLALTLGIAVRRPCTGSLCNSNAAN